MTTHVFICCVDYGSSPKFFLYVSVGVWVRFSVLICLWVFVSCLQRCLRETTKMKAGKILLLLLCLNVISFGVVKNFFIFVVISK
jgi:hypothetical protein